MRFMDIAEVISSSSTADRRKVGAVISSPDGRIISSGYNGTPSGMSNICELEGITKPEVIHAEANAILAAAKHGIPLKGSKLFVTLSPCIECAKMIIQSGVTQVVYKEEYRDMAGVALLRDAGIIVWSR